jgi:hypothetical protein
MSKIVTISFSVVDDDEEDYYRAVWYLTGALALLGSHSQVVPMLRQLFDRALADHRHRTNGLHTKFGVSTPDKA